LYIVYSEYRIARSDGDVPYVVAGVLWEMVGDDGVGVGVGAGAGRRWDTGTAVMSVRVTAVVGLADGELSTGID
jgi:hypothetical protein